MTVQYGNEILFVRLSWHYWQTYIIIIILIIIRSWLLIDDTFGLDYALRFSPLGNRQKILNTLGFTSFFLWIEFEAFQDNYAAWKGLLLNHSLLLKRQKKLVEPCLTQLLAHFTKKDILHEFYLYVIRVTQIPQLFLTIFGQDSHENFSETTLKTELKNSKAGTSALQL